jgi:hypothetical protein
MASSSSNQLDVPESTSNMQRQGAPDSGSAIKPKTMSIPAESLIVQKETPFDFASLEKYEVNMEAFVKP